MGVINTMKYGNNNNGLVKNKCQRQQEIIIYVSTYKDNLLYKITKFD